MNFLKLLQPFVQFQRKKTLNNIHSHNEFRFILDREFKRANRNAHEFSLLVFKTNDTDSDQPTISLTDLITHQVRSTDEVGWFDENSIGILLPDTSARGALNDETSVFGDCCSEGPGYRRQRSGGG